MKFIAALGLALPFVAAKVSYDGYKTFQINANGDYEAVEAALEDIEYVSLSCESNHEVLDIGVAPDSLEAFEALGLDATVLNEDLGAHIAEEGPLMPYESTALRTAPGEARALPSITYFNNYHPFAEHLTFLSDLQAGFPSNSRIFSAGNSGQGRPLQGIHFWGNSGGPGRRPAIVWHGTVHAREWITAPTVEYLAYQIISGYLSGDALSVSTLNAYDFYVIPVVNPDGFVYSQTTDRLWRKNRQSRSGQSCIGTDVNRNWPYKWDTPGGSSTNPCAETYRGQAQGDTAEMRALTSHTLGLANSVGIKFFVDWHSYSQLILLPYGYSCSAVADGLEAQMQLAAGVEAAIRGVNGLRFQYGPVCSTIYQTSGGSTDWAFDVAGADYAWSFELRPSGSAGGGFVIPASNIVPSGREMLAGVRNLFSRF